MDHLKKAMTMKTGRVAMLPPSIYNNPARMKSGQWVLIETPLLEPMTSTAPIEPTVDTLTISEIEPAEPKKRGRKPKTILNDRSEATE